MPSAQVVTQAEEPERPTVVTVIGWVWLVLSGVLALKALVNLLAVSIIRSTAPTLLQGLGEQYARVPFVEWVLRNAGSVMVAQAAFWAIVCFCAFHFLRLRPWARTAIQAVCCLGFVYAACLLVFWIELWQKAGPAMRDPAMTDAKRSLALFAGIVVWILLGSLFGVMLGFLRSARVRETFAGPPVAG